MEARSRRVGGGFPGYDGPALPRAMRSSRGRAGESVKRQSNGVGRTGFFELLATVAGQILQDAGVEERVITDLGEQELSKDKLQSETQSQISSLESVTDHTFVHKPRPEPQVTSHMGASDNEGTAKEEVAALANNGVEPQGCEEMAWILAQEEETKAFVKDISVDESNVVPVHTVTCSPIEDQVMPPLCDRDMTTTQGENASASPAVEIKEMLSVKELLDVEQYAQSTLVESLRTNEVLSKQTMEEDEQATSEIVGETPSIQLEAVTTLENPIDLGSKALGLVDAFEVKIECSEALGELKAGPGPSHEESVQIVNQTCNAIPEIQMQCKISESGEFGELTEISEAKEEDMASMEVEEKGMFVNANNPPSAATSGSFQVATPGLAEGQSTRTMVKGVTSRRDGKFYSREKMNGHRSSQRLHPQTMTKKLKDSYSKGLKARKVAKAVKRNHISGMRTKRQRADMESTDSGSSDDSIFGKSTFFSGMSTSTYTRQRTTRGLTAKRRKVTDGSSKTAPELHLNTSDLLEMGYDCVTGEPPAAAAKLRSAKAASVASSPTARGVAKMALKRSLEPHVKLSIKSFTVPELFVDLPESASVANLKKAVMDAAMNLLGGGLRVRVLMQGKKVSDEAATLSQMGISRNAKPDSLGFMLEPSPVPTSASATAEDPLLVLSRAAHQPSPRYPVFGVPGLSGVGDGGARCPMKGRSSKVKGVVVDSDPSYVPPSVSGDQDCYIDGKRAGLGFSVTPDESVKGCNNLKTSKHLNEKMALSPHSTRVAAAGALAAIRAQADASRRAKNEAESPSTVSNSTTHDSLVAASGALILHPGLGTGENLPGMALVPMRQKISRALDIGKRRVRRPFSVLEVEALVHAVEKLGTGRWRDVKLRAFDQAKHRTYVDLKDKWKTLVHTARIAPHQRRGEPVPQELLERVTGAHTFWTAHAAKQQADLDF